MMITIHGLAPKTKYQDVKLLIKQECNIDDFILDNLIVDSDGIKKVRVGLPDDSEGYKLMKCLNGYRMPGNFPLKVVPVGKPTVNPNISSQGPYESRPAYQNPQRSDYAGPSDYNRAPHSSIPPRGPTISHGSNGPQGASGPQGSSGAHTSSKPYGPGGPVGPMESVRPSPWAANSSNTGQWNPNPPMAAQVPQHTFTYASAAQQNSTPHYTHQHPTHPRMEVRPYDHGRQAVPSEQSFSSYPPKTVAPSTRPPDLRHNLRNIDTMDDGNAGVSSLHNRYPPTQYLHEKPVTILKHNFQGPTQYISHPSGHQSSGQYQHPSTSTPWPQQGHQVLQTKPQFVKASPMVYEKSFEDRKYPPNEQARDPKILQQRPIIYKEYEKRRGFSPPARDPMPRRISPPGRREEPIREAPGRVSDMIHRRASPGRIGDPMQRIISPQVRREDPHEMRYSPARKRISPPPERRIPGHPTMHHEPPLKRISPSRRLVSPNRRDERQLPRYSPERHHSEKLVVDKYGPDGKDLKKVRPAYEPLTSSHAQNQAMYSGGYRPSAHDSVQPASSMRQEQPGPWQRHREEHSAPMKKQEEERRDVRMQIARTRERIPEPAEKRYSPTHKSRSPNRRDRSPIRDRYKRNSPSPRSSYSPRRSWALEKRRSPDAPPPPIWPGQNDRTRPIRSNFIEKDEKPKHEPVWEPRSFKEEDPRARRPDDRRQFEEGKLRVAKELMARETAQQTAMKERYEREPKFSPRDEYEERRENYRRRDSPDRKHHREDFEQSRRPREDVVPDDYNRRRESPRHERKQEDPKNIDKDFEDIYNRAVQFKKKAEEMRKSGSKKRDDFDEDRRHSDKERVDMRQRYEDRARYREEEARRLRERDEMREDRPRDDRIRHDMERRGDYRPRDSQPNEKEQDRPADDNKRSFFNNNAGSSRQKKNKAIEEIAEKIIDRNEEYKHVQGEQRQRILEELKLAVARIVYDMFGDSDVSFIEIIIKYQARYDLKDETRILQEAVRALPKQFRIIKRHAPESLDIPAKTSRHSPSADMKQGPTSRPKLSDSSFNVNLAPPSVISMPCIGVPQAPSIMNQSMIPMMVSTPFYQTFDNLQNPAYAPKPVQPVLDFAQSMQPVLDFQEQVVEFQQPVVDFAPSFSEEELQEGYRLYLCKDDFERITHAEANLLKDFLISQMFNATTHYQGWSPDFTLKGLQSLFRYEVVSRDEQSKNWLLNLDFSDFQYFHVLVYTKEELWYERAAIWLPGHSRVRNIEPLDKLKLQNKKLDGVNIDKWKFVKKIVNEKGTRVYVDMPPSSARALESHGMKLSYELQQVSVFPKAAAVDKNSFDAGLKEYVPITPAEISEAIKNLPMPSLTNDPSLVKIILKGSKTLNLVQARKIKEVVIYNLFQYHQQDGISRTDFIKYGFLQPNYFAIAPLNQESKKWLLGCSFGKVNRQAVVVIGGEEDNTRFFKMHATVPQEYQNSCFSPLRREHIVERLKSSNQGVKGINFNLWKPIKIKALDRKRARFEVDIDMESLETLSSMQYQLDYVDSSGMHTLYFRSEYSQSGLEDLLKKLKAEMMDSYDVANMDLESDQSENEINNDVICLD